MHRTLQDPSALAQELARPTFGVVSRNLLRTHGIDRHRLRRLARQGDLIPDGHHAVRVARAQWDDTRSPVVAAVINSGAAAWAEGTAALVLAGLTGYPLGIIDVGVTENAASRHTDGVRRHRLRNPPPLRHSPVPHAAPAPAVLRAASWASDDEEAVTIVTACVAQHLVTAAALRAEAVLMPTLHRRGLVLDVVGGVEGALPVLHGVDFSRLCRQYAVPEPDLVDHLHGKRESPVLEARWRAAQVTTRIENESCRMRVGASRDVAESVTIAAPGDRILHACAETLRDSPRAYFHQLEELLNGTVAGS